MNPKLALPKTIRFILEASSVYLILGVLETSSEEDLSNLLFRHLTGDWGNLCDKNKEENDCVLKTGSQILSSYLTEHTSVKFWFMTEAPPLSCNLKILVAYNRQPTRFNLPFLEHLLIPQDIRSPKKAFANKAQSPTLT